MKSTPTKVIKCTHVSSFAGKDLENTVLIIKASFEEWSSAFNITALQVTAYCDDMADQLRKLYSAEWIIASRDPGIAFHYKRVEDTVLVRCEHIQIAGSFDRSSCHTVSILDNHSKCTSGEYHIEARLDTVSSLVSSFVSKLDPKEVYKSLVDSNVGHSKLSASPNNATRVDLHRVDA
jgi:hypothetical protein